MENQYPLDFDQLQKGQLLDIQYLERVFSIQYQSSDRWSFLVMGLQAQIHDKTDLTCKIERDSIRILTDAEASENNARQVASHCRGVIRRNEKLLQVDRAALSPEQSAEHDKRINTSSAFAAALVGVRRSIKSQLPELLPKRLEQVQ